MTDEADTPEVNEAIWAGLERIAELLSVLREIDEEILGDCSGQPLQRWERLDGLREMKEKAK